VNINVIWNKKIFSYTEPQEEDVEYYSLRGVRSKDIAVSVEDQELDVKKDKDTFDVFRSLRGISSDEDIGLNENESETDSSSADWSKLEFKKNVTDTPEEVLRWFADDKAKESRWAKEAHQVAKKGMETRLEVEALFSKEEATKVKTTSSPPDKTKTVIRKKDIWQKIVRVFAATGKVIFVKPVVGLAKLLSGLLWRWGKGSSKVLRVILVLAMAGVGGQMTGVVNFNDLFKLVKQTGQGWLERLEKEKVSIEENTEKKQVITEESVPPDNGQKPEEDKLRDNEVLDTQGAKTDNTSPVTVQKAGADQKNEQTSVIRDDNKENINAGRTAVQKEETVQENKRTSDIRANKKEKTDAGQTAVKKASSRQENRIAEDKAADITIDPSILGTFNAIRRITIPIVSQGTHQKLEAISGIDSEVQKIYRELQNGGIKPEKAKQKLEEYLKEVKELSK
jgi:hypothetical protein